MLDSALKNLSISGWYNDGGNRPPALSASSLSSIGEDTIHRIDTHQGFHGNPQNASPSPYNLGIQPPPYSGAIASSGISRASSVERTSHSLASSRPVGHNYLGTTATVPWSNSIPSSQGNTDDTPYDSSQDSFLFNRSTRSSNYERYSSKSCNEIDEMSLGSAIGTWNHYSKFPQSMDSVRENEEFSLAPGPAQRYQKQQSFGSNRILSSNNSLIMPSIHRVQSADAACNVPLRHPNGNFELCPQTTFSDSSNRTRAFSSDFNHVHRSADTRIDTPYGGGEYKYDNGPSLNFSLREIPSSYVHNRNGIFPNDSPTRFQSHAESAHFYKINPQVAPAALPRKTVYTVKFKRSQKNFFLSDTISSEIKIGSYVRVEADRGEDLGVVLSRIPIDTFNPGSRNGGISDLQLKRILCLASEDDIEQYSVKEEEEAELLKICRSKAVQRGLPMNVIDAEYQFDRHKLTFFFEASGRVDFRELVRDLFSIYKTRIWMQQIDKSSGHPCLSLEQLHVYGSDW